MGVLSAFNMNPIPLRDSLHMNGRTLKVSEARPRSEGSGYAWDVYLGNGNVVSGAKSIYRYVWPVRRGN